jgi:hypothetical protein
VQGSEQVVNAAYAEFSAAEHGKQRKPDKQAAGHQTANIASLCPQSSEPGPIAVLVILAGNLSDEVVIFEYIKVIAIDNAGYASADFSAAYITLPPVDFPLIEKKRVILFKTLVVMYLCFEIC